MNSALIRSSVLALVLLAAPGCSEKPALKAVKATQADVETTISTTTAGTVDALQKAVLNFGAIGRVEQVLVRAGEKARKGQLLAKLENRDLRIILDNSRKELRRTQALLQEGLVSRAGYDDARRAYEVAQANFDRTEIRAPFDGAITDVNLQVGELSQSQYPSDKPPIRIVDEKPRIIKGVIDEVDLSKVKVGAIARVKIPAVRPRPFLATVVRVVPYVSTSKEQERTAQIELEIQPSEGGAGASIPVGASAETEVIIESKQRALAVPSRAVLGTGGSRYVFRFDVGRIHKNAIKTGVGNYERTEVVEGLKAGDVVVLPGDVELKDGMKAKVELTPWP